MQVDPPAVRAEDFEVPAVKGHDPGEERNRIVREGSGAVADESYARRDGDVDRIPLG